MNLDRTIHVADPGEHPHRPCSFLLPANIAGVVKIADVAAAPVDWLWPRRIPIGRLTLLVGDSGLGKSLITLDVAARVSRAAPWPDHKLDSVHLLPSSATTNSQDADHLTNQATSPPSALPLPPAPGVPPRPASVVLLTAEDDLADTVRPRLDALGADCARIYAIPAQVDLDADQDEPRDAGLRRDLKRIGQLLDALPDCRLVVIDPVSAYLAGSENSSTDVRRLLKPLATLASQRRLAVIAVSHLRKKDGSILYRTNGSLAFVNSARAAWLIKRDPDDGNRRLMLPIKSNLAADATGLAFTIESSGNGKKHKTDATGRPVICWQTDLPTASADQLASGNSNGRPSHERDEAARWLAQALAVGARPSAHIESEATAYGFRLITLRRAFRELGGEAVRLGFGPLGQWYWRLPGIGDQNPEPSLDHLWPNAESFTRKPEAQV